MTGAFFFFFSSRRRHTRYWRDWSSDVCSSDLGGVRLVRELLRDFADEGRTVLVSGHPSSGLEETADHLLVLDRGRLLADVPVADLLGAGAAIRVRSPRAPLLAAALRDLGAEVALEVDGGLRV